MHHPSHLRIKATTSRKQLDPLPSQLSHKKEKRKKKKKNKNTQRRDSHTGTSVIHQHDQDFRTINHHGHHAKCRPQKQHIRRADEYVKKCLVCWKERLHAARTFSKDAGIPWVAHPISKCDTCTLFDHHTSVLHNKDTCHNVTIPPASSCCNSWTTILQPNFSYSHHDRSTHAKDVLLVHGKSCSSIDYTGWNSSWTLQLCDWKKNRIRCVRYYIRYERGEWLKECLYGNPSLPKLFAINQWCMIPPPTGTLWLCGTSVYSILPSQFNGRCTLVYVLPAIRENTHSTSSSPHLQNSASTNKDGCIPGLTCVQTWWSRTLGALIPSYGVMQALDQVRSLSDSVQKLANDTVLALGNIKDTLASHKMMILQNRVALDYILATQGGACTIIGPECCTGLMDPTENLNKIQQDILGLSEKLRQMTEDNSSWFGNLLGKPWLWIKEIAILLLFLLLAYYLCIHSIKCFCQQMTPASHKEMTVPTRKDYYP